MKRYSHITTLVLLGGFTLVFPLSIAALDSFKGNTEENRLLLSAAQKDETKKKNKDQSKYRIFAYKPPMRGAPGNRIGGGTRGITDDLPFLTVLTPDDHVGLTTQSQPALYWYLSKPTSKRMELTLNDERAAKTLLRVDLGTANKKGVHHLSLFDHKVNLSSGVEYRWFITMVLDPDQPSKDIFSGGTIKLVKPSKTLEKKLSQAKSGEIPAIYAQEGLWYDALWALSELIEANPEDKSLREQRASLIEQVGLHEVAEFESHPNDHDHF